MGGFGVVYRAFDREMQRSVALKTLHRVTAESLYRFKHEFRTLAAIRHPNLVTPYELVQEDDNWYFTMEIVAGVDFVRWVRGAGADIDARAGRLLDALAQLTAGISALHARGKVHCDIKPFNVLVTRGGRVVLLDLGTAVGARWKRLASVADGSEGGAGAGTPRYMAPEVLRGDEATRASDWYSVGLMMCEALGGAPGEPGNAGSSSDRVFSEALHAGGIAAALSALSSALLQPEPSARAGEAQILAVVDELCAQRCGCGRAPRRAATVEGCGYEVAQPGYPAGLRSSGGNHGGRSHPMWARGTAPMDATRSILTLHTTKARAAWASGCEEGDALLVLRGRCRPNESIRFKALDELMDALSGALQDEDECAIRGWAGEELQELVALFPVLGRALTGGATSRARASCDGGRDGEVAPANPCRARAARALCGILAGLARTRRVVLLIEDADFGDAESAAFLEEVLRHPEAPPLTCAVAWRGAPGERSGFLTTYVPVAESLGAYARGALGAGGKVACAY